MKNAIENVLNALTALENKILDSSIADQDKRWHIYTFHLMQDSLIRLSGELEEDNITGVAKAETDFLLGTDPEWLLKANNDL